MTGRVALRDWTAPGALVVTITVAAFSASHAGEAWSAAIRAMCGIAAVGALSYRAARTKSRGRLAWVLLAVGIGVWVAGDALWDSLDLVRVPVSSNWFAAPDVLYLLMYPVLFAAITRPVSRRRRPDRGVLADCAVLFLITLVTLRGFVIPTGLDLSTTDGFFNAIYPFGDALLLAGAAWAVFTGVRMTGSTVLIGSGLVLVLACDVAWEWQMRVSSTVLNQNVIDAVYSVSYAVIGAAALHPSARGSVAVWRRPVATTPSTARSRARLLLLYASFAVMPLMVFTLSQHDVASRLSVVVLVLLLALRFSAVVREARVAHAQAEANARRYLTLADAAPVAIYEADANDRIVFTNGEGAAIVGPDAVGNDFRAVFRDIATARSVSAAPQIDPGRRESGQFQVHGADGTLRWLAWYTAPVRAIDGAVTGAIAATIDITAMKDAQEQLALQATHDPLTGLPNRRLLFDRMSAGLARSARQQGRVAVLFIDIDGFKVVNDRHGHDVGDDLLKAVTARIRHTVRAEDTVARYGGDEFVVVAERVRDRRHAATIANKIIEAVNRIEQVNGRPVSVSASVGIVIADSPDDDPDVLVRHADEAMYQAKGSGSGLVRFYGADNSGHRVAVRGYR